MGRLKEGTPLETEDDKGMAGLTLARRCHATRTRGRVARYCIVCWSLVSYGTNAVLPAVPWPMNMDVPCVAQSPGTQAEAPPQLLMWQRILLLTCPSVYTFMCTVEAIRTESPGTAALGALAFKSTSCDVHVRH